MATNNVINTNTSVYLGNSLSVSVWARDYSNNPSGISNYVLGKGNDFVIGHVDWGGTGWGFYTGDWHYVTDSQNLTNNTWTHIVGTYDGTTMRLYKNGVNVANTTYTGSIPQSGGNWILGAATTTPNYPYDGSIDMAYFWNRTLTNPEIIQLYNEGTGMIYFNESAASTISISPADSYETLSTLINFSCSGNATALANISLLTNETSWGIKNTTSITGVYNISNWFRTLPIGVYLWDCQSCDTSNVCYYSNNRTLNIKGLVENNQTFNNNTIEGNSETFIINISYDSSYYPNIVGRLVYDGTFYTGTQTGSGTNTIFTKIINIPSVTSDINKTFYWTFSMIHNSISTD
jgi:hypothetical protein